MSIEDVKANITNITERFDRDSPTVEADGFRAMLGDSILKMTGLMEEAVTELLNLNREGLLDLHSACTTTANQADAAERELAQVAGSSVSVRAGKMLTGFARHKAASEQLKGVGYQVSEEVEKLLGLLINATEPIGNMNRLAATLRDNENPPSLEFTKQQAIQDAHTYRDTL